MLIESANLAAFNEGLSHSHIDTYCSTVDIKLLNGETD